MYIQILCFSKLHLHFSRVLFNLAGVLHWLGVTGTGTGKGTDKFKITLQWMLEGRLELPHCPGRKTPKRAVKHPARPCKSAMQNRFAIEKAKER